MAEPQPGCPPRHPMHPRPKKQPKPEEKPLNAHRIFLTKLPKRLNPSGAILSPRRLAGQARLENLWNRESDAIRKKCGEQMKIHQKKRNAKIRSDQAKQSQLNKDCEAENLRLTTHPRSIEQAAGGYRAWLADLPAEPTECFKTLESRWAEEHTERRRKMTQRERDELAREQRKAQKEKQQEIDTHNAARDLLEQKKKKANAERMARKGAQQASKKKVTWELAFDDFMSKQSKAKRALLDNQREQGRKQRVAHTAGRFREKWDRCTNKWEQEPRGKPRGWPTPPADLFASNCPACAPMSVPDLVRQVASRTVSRLTGSFGSTAKQSSPSAQRPQSSTGWRLHGSGELNATTMEEEGEVSVEAVQGA